MKVSTRNVMNTSDTTSMAIHLVHSTEVVAITLLTFLSYGACENSFKQTLGIGVMCTVALTAKIFQSGLRMVRMNEYSKFDLSRSINKQIWFLSNNVTDRFCVHGAILFEKFPEVTLTIKYASSKIDRKPHTN